MLLAALGTLGWLLIETRAGRCLSVEGWFTARYVRCYRSVQVKWGKGTDEREKFY